MVEKQEQRKEMREASILTGKQEKTMEEKNTEHRSDRNKQKQKNVTKKDRRENF